MDESSGNRKDTGVQLGRGEQQWRERLELMVGEMGHVKDTSKVLLDIDKDEKNALLLHSEKLIGTEQHPTMIRVCNDYHSVMKLASKAFGQEIVQGIETDSIGSVKECAAVAISRNTETTSS